jgi:adenylate kinase
MKTQISILVIGCVLVGGVVGYIYGYKTKERAADIELTEMTNLAFSAQNYSVIQSYLMLGERLKSPTPKNIDEMREILIGQFELSIANAESDPEKADMTTHADIQKAKGLLAVLKKQAQQVGAPNPLPAE